MTSMKSVMSEALSIAMLRRNGTASFRPKRGIR